MNTTATKRTIWIIQLANGKFAGSPIVTVAPNRNMAGSFTDKTEADKAAAFLGNGAVVVPY